MKSCESVKDGAADIIKGAVPTFVTITVAVGFEPVALLRVQFWQERDAFGTGRIPLISRIRWFPESEMIKLPA